MGARGSLPSLLRLEADHRAHGDRNPRRDGTMGRLQLLRLFVVIIAVALPLVGRGTAAQEDSFLKVAQDPAVGSFLTDAEGKTLYLFTPDSTPSESACYDDCAKSWPPLASAEGMTLPAGVPGKLAT